MDYANAGMTAVWLGRAAVSTKGDKAGARTGAVVSGTEAAKVEQEHKGNGAACKHVLKISHVEISIANIYRLYFSDGRSEGLVGSTFCYTPAFHIDA